MSLDYVWLIPAFPLVGAIINGLFGRWMPRWLVAILACASVGASFVLAVLSYVALNRLPEDAQAHTSTLYTWIASGSFRADISALVDPLSIFMVLVVTGVGFFIHLYSTGYMSHDPRLSRYFTYLNLFMFSMLLLVLAGNFLLLFVGWELVGLCSYLLIGFWYERTSAANAGKKAFIVTRIGDLGFTLGIVLIFLTFGSLRYLDVFASAPGVATATIAAITLLLLAGAIGKSAQIPLYVWLPDAMEGPTPVSALIHAATMVTAGVYLLARCHPLYELVPGVLTVVAIIGATTAFFAATIGAVNNDIKRVLAYSTISQIGYMFLGAGVGAFVAAIFHLMTHAFFKALLFLGAGSVMHATDGETDIRNMGALGHKMPITKWTFWIGALALAGIFPMSGFFSKDEILWGAYSSPYGSPLLYLVGLLTAGLTAFYIFRVVFKTFHGQSRMAAQASAHVHESPPSMTLPLIVLAILATIGGFAGIPHAFEPVTGLHNYVAGFLGPALEPGTAEHGAESPLGLQLMIMAVTLMTALAGIFIAYYLYVRRPGTAGALARRYPGLYSLVYNKYYVDEIYDAVFVRPLKTAALWLWKRIDEKLIDRSVNGLASGVAGAASMMRRTQTGFVRNYALAMLAGAVVIVTFLLLR